VLHTHRNRERWYFSTIKKVLMNIVTLFTGFGGVDIGAKMAGINPVMGIEYDPKIAQVAINNLGDHIIVGDVCKINRYQECDILHASPPCPNFSVAKKGAKETELDIQMAEAVCRFIENCNPQIFTLENVWGYRRSQSWKIIINTLNRLGYWSDVAHVNMADYGIPQSRKRMIVRAMKGSFVPHLPPKQKHISWYEAIEDLIPTFKECKLADWQVNLLPQSTVTSGGSLPKIIFNQSSSARNPTHYSFPSPTVTGSSQKGGRVITNDVILRPSVRAMARLQTFPDWYELPQGKSLAMKGIGNAVPPLFYKTIIEQLI